MKSIVFFRFIVFGIGMVILGAPLALAHPKTPSSDHSTMVGCGAFQHADCPASGENSHCFGCVDSSGTACPIEAIYTIPKGQECFFTAEVTSINWSNTKALTSISTSKTGSGSCDIGGQDIGVFSLYNITNSCGANDPNWELHCKSDGGGDTQIAISYGAAQEDIDFDMTLCCQAIGDPAGVCNPPVASCSTPACNLEGCFAELTNDASLVYVRDLLDPETRTPIPMPVSFPGKSAEDIMGTGTADNPYANHEKFTCRFNGTIENAHDIEPDESYELWVYPREGYLNPSSNRPTYEPTGQRFLGTGYPGAEESNITCTSRKSAIPFEQVVYASNQTWRWRENNRCNSLPPSNDDDDVNHFRSRIPFASDACEASEFDFTCTFDAGSIPQESTFGSGPNCNPADGPYHEDNRQKWDPHLRFRPLAVDPGNVPGPGGYNTESAYINYSICCCDGNDISCCLPNSRAILVPSK